MQFVNPWFLVGILGIIIPILIHLFNFRRFRKVYFTNVKFIEELKLQTQKQSRLKHLLVLLARILTILCLSLAFAQPFIPVDNHRIHPNSRNAVSIYTDNSYSMEAKGTRGSLLDEAKQKALETGSSFQPSDLFQVLTSDFEGKHQRFASREELDDMLNEITFSSSSRMLSDVIRRQQDLLSTAGNASKNIFIISDFQKSTTDLDKCKLDSSDRMFLIPVKAGQTANLFIDSCWFDSPVQQLNQSASLRIRIKNTSTIDQEKIPVKLMINNSQKALASFNCQAKSETEVILSFTNNETGIHHAYLEIVDYPIIYDDKFYFTYEVYNTIPVLTISEKAENQYLYNLFARDSSFQYSAASVNTLDYSSLANYRLLVFNEVKSFSTGLLQETKNFLDKGGSILVLPPQNMDPEDYSSLLSSFNLGAFTKQDTTDTKVMKLDAAHSLYRDVFDKIPENLDLPVVFNHYPMLYPSNSRAEVILKLENDDPFLISFTYNKGKIYVLTAALQADYTNFGKHLLFVPTFYKIALLSQPSDRLFYYIGREDAVELSSLENKGDEVYKVKKLGETYEFIPENRIIGSQVFFYPHDQLKEAGNYNILDGSSIVGGLSFNYDSRESMMDFYTPEELKSLSEKSGLKNVSVLDISDKPVSLVIEEMNKGVRLWKWFIIMALLFLAAEIAILRFWKHS